MTPARAKREDEYHHGGLRSALIDASFDLIREGGMDAFSVAEASRRLGVSAPASYRHFAGRDDLLAQVAVQVSTMLTAALQEGATTGGSPEEQLALIAAAYVRFAAAEPRLFEALLSVGRQKHDHPELEQAAEPLVQAFFRPALAICAGDAGDAGQLVLAVLATAHGHAGLLLEGLFEPNGEATTVAASRANVAVRALVEGWKTIAQRRGVAGIAGAA